MKEIVADGRPLRSGEGVAPDSSTYSRHPILRSAN